MWAQASATVHHSLTGLVTGSIAIVFDHGWNKYSTKMGFERVFIYDNPEELSKVTKIFCSECQNFYSKSPKELDCLQGHIKKLVKKESR